jgi:hypothetical protein
MWLTICLYWVYFRSWFPRIKIAWILKWKGYQKSFESSRFWLITYLLFFNRQSAFLWVLLPTVLFCSTCFFIRTNWFHLIGNFVLEQSWLSISKCRSRYEADLTVYLQYPLFQAQWDICVGIPMGTSTNCALLFDLFLYSYNAGLKQGLLKKEKLDRFLKCMLCYTDAFSLNNS